MKRLSGLVVLLMFGVASATTPTVVLDPKPGTYVGQTATITNTSATTVSVAGDTGVKLRAAVTLLAGASLTVVWNGTNWVEPDAANGQFGNSVSFTYDFPPVSSVVLGTPCLETPTQTVAGAVIGDFCKISSNLGADGGSRLLDTAKLSCDAVTGGAIAKLCVQLTDGGSYDLHDAGFTMGVSR